MRLMLSMASRYTSIVSDQGIEQLFAMTLEGAYDDDEPWNAVNALRRIGSREVLDLAVDWCQSDDPIRRARGADILAQLGKTVGHPVNTFPDESFAAVTGMLKMERDIQPLSSAIFALGHLDTAGAVPLICPFEDHPDANVRYAVAFSAGSYPDDPRATRTLIKLMNDTNEDIRDWATFGLGVQGSTNSVEIREALAARLTDTNVNAREEAILALAKRHDRRVIPIVADALAESGPSSRIFEAASLLLGLEQDAPEMPASDYRAALKRHFATEVITPERE